MMTKSKISLLTAIAATAIFSAPGAFAQDAGATVHGHINNAAGLPLVTGSVKFTKDRTVPTAEIKFAPNMIFPIDGNGNYKATGIGPGEYYVFIVQGDVIADRVDLTIRSNDIDKTLDDDMSREEYIKTMTAEQRKALEEFKKKNASANAINAVVGKLNITLKTVQTDLAAAAPTKGDVSADVAMMKEATEAKPDEPILWTNYGNTLLAQGDHLAKVNKADPDANKTYAEAVDAYKKGIDLDAASKKPNPANAAAAYNQMGNALSHSGKGPEAAAAFESAVKLQPTNASLYYRNEAVVFYTASQYDEAVAAADKTIAADPKDALAYYIKAQSLAVKTTTDKAGKMVPPPGCVDAYQMFLQLAPPTDPKVADAKQMLDAFGEKVQTKFKAK